MTLPSNRARCFCLVTGVALFAGCATQAAAPRPDDNSVAGHRAMAKKERREAKRSEQRYDPNARATVEESPATAAEIDAPYNEAAYNPTAFYRDRAKRLREHARQHLAAAKALERFEAASCGKFPDKTRVVCPLLGQVVRAEPIEGGVRLVLAKGVNIQAMLAHMRCHYAFGRKMGRAGMRNCPLYLKGLAMGLSSDRTSIELTASDPAVVQQIRERSATHVVSAHHASR